MEKKIKGVLLALVLMFVITLGFIPGVETAMTVHAADDSGVCDNYYCGNIAWELDGTTLTISKADGASSGDMCYKCYKQWYSYVTIIEKIVIKEGVTSIEDCVFMGCENLTEITIPVGITSIGHESFSGCSSLISITIPDEVTSIGNEAFLDCSSLNSITIPDKVTYIGYSAFSGCSSLTSVIIPDGVTSISSMTFSDCSSLTSITIPEGVTCIEYSAFSGCSSLASITIPEGVTSIGGSVFSNCSSLTSITIPEGVTSIGDSAFGSCSNMTIIKIPDTVTSMGNYVFFGCSSLTSITIPEGVTGIGDGAFSNCSSLTSITIPEGVTSIGDSAFGSCSNMTIIKIPDTVTSMGNYVFSGCRNLTEITIPMGMTDIGYNSFEICINLKIARIPCTLMEKKVFIFEADCFPKIICVHSGSSCIADEITNSLALKCTCCENTYTVTLEAPTQTTYTGKPVEATCIGVSEYFAPIITYSGINLVDGKPVHPGTYTATLSHENHKVSVEYTITASSGKCSECGNIAWDLKGTTLTVSKAIGATSGDMCDSCKEQWSDLNYTEVIVSSGVKSICDAAFNDCQSLKSVVISDGVTNIGVGAFAGCTSLTSVTIPGSVENLGTGMFGGCTNLKYVTLSDGIKSIGAGAFNYCLNLTDITIPETVITIGAQAFNSCTKLTNITIPNSVTKVEENAFAYCENLSSATMPCGLKDQVISNKVFLEANPTINYIHATTTCIADDTKNTLTLTCTCGENAYVATLKAPSKKAYTGKPIVATCTGTSADFAPTITYSGTKLVNGKPVYPGSYTATLTYGDKKVSLKYTITEATAPAKPNKITNVVSGIHVYWPAVSGVSKYGLWRSETGVNGTYKWIANPTAAHFTDTKVTSGKTYYYKVTILDTVNNVHSAKSAAIGITYVATPDITSRVNQAAGVKLGWNKIAGATGYAIYRKPYSGNSAWVRVGTIDSPNILTWTDESVKTANGSMYKYTIRALAGSNSKTLSGCRGAGRTMVRLSSRTLSSATKANATSIKCSWNTTSQATGYEVRFMVGSTVYKTYTVGNYKTGVKTFTGLKAGQTYKVQVRSYKKVDGVGTFYSAWSTEKIVTL